MPLPRPLQHAVGWMHTSRVQKMLIVTATVCFAWSAAGCGDAAVDRATAPPASPSPTAASTPVPSATPPPTATPVPTATPAPTATAVPAPPASPWPQRIRYGDDPAQIGWLRVPDAAVERTVGLPVIVLLHGGFWAEPWDYTLMSDLAIGLDELGIATWNIEFRRLRGRGGWPATFDDVRAAIDHLSVLGEEHPLDLDSVVLLGHSSGGHLALWAARDDVATTPPVQHAIGIAAITDLRLTTASIGLLGGTPSEVPNRWEAAAPSLDPKRVSLIHGAADSDVPLFAVDNAVEAGVRVEVVDDGTHFSMITADSPGFADVLALVEDVLAAG